MIKYSDFGIMIKHRPENLQSRLKYMNIGKNDKLYILIMKHKLEIQI